MKKIYVTESFLPPKKEYEHYLDSIWESKQLTNQGPLLKKLENGLKKYLHIKNFHFVSNGTIAIQVALKSLNITEGEIITTPFSYVATTSSILWERCTPVFVDINPQTFCIDADKIEGAITKQTKAIVAVHVFGYPCDINKIETIAKKHHLKVIYDAAHAFGSVYKNKSLLDYGDISTCSFHATKIFHTIEGGGIITKYKKISDKVELIKRFGHTQEEHTTLGINAKASEFQAAMGLSNLKYVKKIILSRKKISKIYDNLLKDTGIKRPFLPNTLKYNYAYYPVVFSSKKEMLNTVKELNKAEIYPRRYFYPSLNTLPYLTKYQKCPISEDISSRIVCLPLYVNLKKKTIIDICKIINKNIQI